MTDIIDDINRKMEFGENDDFPNEEMIEFKKSYLNIFGEKFSVPESDSEDDIYTTGITTGYPGNPIIKEEDNRKKGRKKKPENKINIFHSKENDDNIRRKIKCHFHNFIINYFNNLIKEKKKGNLKFKKIKYSYALNDTMKFNKILLLSKISDFFKLDISNKYKKYKKNENEIVYEKLIKRFDNEERQIFNLTYMEFYEKYYLNKAFNNSSNLNNFYSLIENERKNELDENEIKYSNLLKLIAEQRFINYYLPNRLFMTKKLFSN